MSKKILIVDDEEEIIDLFSDILQMRGYTVASALSGDEALNRIEDFQPDLVLLDVQFGEEGRSEGVNILKRIRTQWPLAELPVMIVSGKCGSEDLVEAKLNGANAVELKSRFDRVVRKIGDLLGGRASGPPQESVSEPARLRGKGTREITVQLLEYAAQDCNVLILGETGSGKSLAAETFRQASKRKEVFCRIDCAALPENLMQSELFGVAPGGYTSAVSRTGKLEEADHGILFFDEIGELKPDQQKVLLHFWDHREVTRLGSNKKIKLDVVILAATNQDLEKLVAENKFRSDLFRRLWSHVVRMPPLREMREDIPVLVKEFVAQFGRKHGKNVTGVDGEVMDLLMRLEWPGNVGDLSHCVEDGVVNSSGPLIRKEDLKSLAARNGQADAADQRNPATLRELWQQQEQEEAKIIRDRYEACNRNQSQTARILGISREALIQKLKKYGLL